jgi:hypothetical protein
MGRNPGSFPTGPIDLSLYDTPDTAWRYEYYLVTARKARDEALIVFRTNEAQVNALLNNPPEKAARVRRDRLLDQEIG